VGLLETFSPQPFAFHDSDLVVLENLAETILEIRSSFKPKPTTPNLLFELEPAYRVFFGNLIETLRPPQLPPLKMTSLPSRFWPDVFVPAQLPWRRFAESMLLHVIMVVALGGLLEFGFSQPQMRQSQLTFNKSDVIYYLRSDHLPSPKRDAGPSPSRRTQPPASVKQPVISVSRESGGRTPAVITPPDIKLKQELRLASIMPLKSVLPAVPITTTVRSQRRMPAVGGPSVIAPPPDISQVSPSQHLTPATSVVIEPPPSVDQSIRQVASISIGQLQVVGPAPEMSLHQQVTFPAQRTLIASTSVVPPPPSLGGLGNTADRTSSLPGEMPVVPPAPSLQSASLRSAGNYPGGSSDGMAVRVVPPPPSINGLGRAGSQGGSSLLAAGMPTAPLPAAIHPASYGSRGGAPTTLTSGLPGGLLPGEIIPNHEETHAATKELPNTRELSVNFMVPALVLPMSSYFSNYEVFIAEQRLTRHQSRLIKLVYEFLPYQPRLSAYGPNHPGIENLRATRDRSCDQDLVQVASSASTVSWSQSDRLQLSAKSLTQLQSRLECYRTTADDYRRARARQHRQKIATSSPGSDVLPD
jgi:hypothetical protein